MNKKLVIAAAIVCLIAGLINIDGREAIGGSVLILTAGGLFAMLYLKKDKEDEK